jgi:hypothetical protein
MLAEDRRRADRSVEHAARRLRISLTGSSRAGERWSSWEAYDRIAAAFGWPRSFR